MSCGGRAASQPGQNGLKKISQAAFARVRESSGGQCSAATTAISVGFGRSEKLQYRATGLTAQRQANAQ
jgi:hypothetical protein